jgi:hypothetical protein
MIRIKPAQLLSAVILLFCVPIASAQDCKPDGSASFAQLKNSIWRFTTSHGYSGRDEKDWNQSGDLASVAIVQSLPGNQMTSPQTLREVLYVLHEAFACPSRCVTAPSDRQPRITLLLLEHLQNKSSGKMQSEIEETKEFILEHSVE